MNRRLSKAVAISHPAQAHVSGRVLRSHTKRAKDKKSSRRPVKRASSASLDSLSEELLSRIFQLLPWRDRVECVERVSKKWNALMWRSGWADYTRFNDEDLESDDYIAEWERLPVVS